MSRGHNLRRIELCLPRLHIFTMAYIHIHIHVALHKNASWTLHNNLGFIHQYHAYTTLIYFCLRWENLEETAGEMLILLHAGQKTRVVIRLKKRSKDLNIQQNLSPMGV